MAKEDYIKVCPRCGSTNARFSDLKIDAGPMGDTCEDCGFGDAGNSVSFPEVVKSKLQYFKKALKNKSKKK